jgi:hypothetical protein
VTQRLVENEPRGEIDIGRWRLPPWPPQNSSPYCKSTRRVLNNRESHTSRLIPGKWEIWINWTLRPRKIKANSLSSIHGVIMNKFPAHSQWLRIPSVQVPLRILLSTNIRDRIDIPAKTSVSGTSDLIAKLIFFHLCWSSRPRLNTALLRKKSSLRRTMCDYIWQRSQ